MSTKILERAEIKAATTVDQQRQIEFYMLAFQPTPDKQGDIIAPDAADAWLAKFYEQGFPLPISFTHAAVRDSTDPFAIVGYAPADPEHVFKDEHGIRVRAFLDTGANETAQQVYMLTKRGIVSGASVAYIAEKETLRSDGSTLIQQMSILEAGPCLDPANDAAYVISVKNNVTETGTIEPEVTVTLSLADWDSLNAKAGRKLSAATAAKLNQARALMDEVLALVQEASSLDSEGKANEEEPEEANSEELSPNADLREALAAI